MRPIRAAIAHKRARASAAGLPRGSRILLLIAQPQKGERAHQRGLDIVAQRARFFDLGNQIGRMRGKFGIGMPFGHDIVIVGVKPFGHFHRKLRGIAARQLEISGRLRLAASKPKRLGMQPQRHLRVEHLVVKRKIAHRQQIGTGRFLRRPVERRISAATACNSASLSRLSKKPLRQISTRASRRCGDSRSNGMCSYGFPVGYKGINLSMLLY